MKNIVQKWYLIYKQKKISNLSNRKDTVISKQDKGRDVGIMDRSNYTETCVSLLSSNQFAHIANDPIKSLKSKVQQTIQKIKSNLPEQKYKKLYPTGSCLGKVYRTCKITLIKWWYQ